MPASCGKLRDALGDRLPGTDARCIAFQDERADLLGGMERSVLAVGLQHPVGAGPQLPLAEHQRQEPAMPRRRAMKP